MRHINRIAAILAAGLIIASCSNSAEGSSSKSDGSGQSGQPSSQTADNPSQSGGSAQQGEPSSVAGVDQKVLDVFNLTNAFRTGAEAFYVNQDGTTQTSLVGKLGTLTLDDDLCKAAAVRAKEIVTNFSHTRPNGTSCFTVFKELNISYSGVGENIAAGSSTGSATFTQWKEDGKPYSGQGHRRNMLGDFTKIGIAYAYDAESRYKYYWVMILAK